MASRGMERKILAAEERRAELESQLKEKDIIIERLEKDRRWLAQRETEEKEEKEKIQADSLKDKVGSFIRVFVRRN